MRPPILIPAIAFVLPWLGTPQLKAQNVSIVVPRVAEAVDGNRWMTTHFREAQPRRIQIVIGAEHLVGLAGKRIHKLAFRKDVKHLRPYARIRGGESTRIRIVASWSDADPRFPSLTYSNNHASPQILFDGSVILPKVSGNETRKVASFDPSEAPTIALQTHIAHVPGKSLVLDFTTYGGNEGYTWDWPVDAHTKFEPGVAKTIGSSCFTSKWSNNINIVKGSMRPGMHLKTDCLAPPNPVAAFMVFGLSDRLAFGVLPLPLRIAEPGCDLFVSPDVMAPAIFYQGPNGVAGGWAASEVALPYMQSLHGAKLYFQYVFLHSEQQTLALKTTHGVEATLAANPPSLGISLVASMDTSAATGRVFLDFSPVMQFEAR